MLFPANLLRKPKCRQQLLRCAKGDFGHIRLSLQHTNSCIRLARYEKYY